MARSLKDIAVENAKREAAEALHRVWDNVEAANPLADDCIEVARATVGMALDIAAQRFSGHEVSQIHIIKGFLALVMNDLDKRIERTHAAPGEMKGPLCSF